LEKLLHNKSSLPPTKESHFSCAHFFRQLCIFKEINQTALRTTLLPTGTTNKGQEKSHPFLCKARKSYVKLIQFNNGSSFTLIVDPYDFQSFRGSESVGLQGLGFCCSFLSQNLHYLVFYT